MDNSKKKNFDLSKVKLLRTISTHANTVKSVCILRDGTLASCSGDKTIKIYNLSTNVCEITLRGHKECINHILQLNTGYIVSCSRDSTIKIWEIKRRHYQCIKTLKEHNDYVNKIVEMSRNRLFSCSGDKTIKIWNSYSPFNCIDTLFGTTTWANSLIELKNKKYFVSCSYYINLSFWDNVTYDCVKTIKQICCFNRNSLVEIKGKIFVGGINYISVVNSSTMQLEAKIKLEEIKSFYSFLNIGSYDLLCGCEEGDMFQVDINEYKIIGFKEHAHLGNVTCLLMANNKYIISSSDDKTIKIWAYC